MTSWQAFRAGMFLLALFLPANRSVHINPSQEAYYNSINPLVEGVPHIFTGLHLGGPTYSQSSNNQGPLA